MRIIYAILFMAMLFLVPPLLPVVGYYEYRDKLHDWATFIVILAGGLAFILALIVLFILAMGG